MPVLLEFLYPLDQEVAMFACLEPGTARAVLLGAAVAFLQEDETFRDPGGRGRLHTRHADRDGRRRSGGGDGLGRGGPAARRGVHGGILPVHPEDVGITPAAGYAPGRKTWRTG